MVDYHKIFEGISKGSNMGDQAYAKVQVQQKTTIGSSSKNSLLQRTCACGKHTIAGAQCSTCRSEQSTLHRSQRAFEPPSAPVVVQGSSPAQENGTSFNSAFDSASHFGHDFSQIPVYSLHPPMLQTKLTVNQPGDAHEQEADQVAGQVMRMANLKVALSDGQDEAKNSLMRKQSSEPQADTEADISSVPLVVHTVLNSGGGQPLDPATRAFMEPRFGHDFSQVRVHTDAPAAESARAVGALAYTVGRDVVFGTGQYAPRTMQGQKLLVHELTHVVQQVGSRPTVQGILMMGAPGDVLEREADKVARETLRGSPPAVNRTAYSQPALQKKDKGDAIELDFVTVDPVEEARLKKLGITLPPGIKQTNPEDKCPKGYQPMERATWFRCDESAGTKRLGCAFCTPQGQQCKCTDLLQSLGHNRIIAPRNRGRCGDWFKITSPKKGAPILDVIKAEIPGGDTDLDIHKEVIKQLGEDVDAGRYDVCLRGPEIHDDRLVPCGGSKCPTPKSSPKKKG